MPEEPNFEIPAGVQPPLEGFPEVPEQDSPNPAYTPSPHRQHRGEIKQDRRSLGPTQKLTADEPPRHVRIEVRDIQEGEPLTEEERLIGAEAARRILDRLEKGDSQETGENKE